MGNGYSTRRRSNAPQTVLLCLLFFLCTAYAGVLWYFASKSPTPWLQLALQAFGYLSLLLAGVAAGTLAYRLFGEED